MAGAVVVYESVFGDAERIARAVAAGLSEHLDVEVVAAAEAPPSFGPDLRLLVVGGPDHAMGMPGPASREDVVSTYAARLTDTAVGLHEWLDAAQPLHGIAAAAFDTRMDRPKLTTGLDHTARTEEKLLHSLGATLAAPAEHFHVVDVQGPLAAGEEDHARLWGAALSEIVTAGTRR